MIVYTPEQREQIIRQSAGKVIDHLEYDEDGRYWTFVFTDGSETSFRFMAELYGGR